MPPPPLPPPLGAKVLEVEERMGKLQTDEGPSGAEDQAAAQPDMLWADSSDPEVDTSGVEPA